MIEKIKYHKSQIGYYDSLWIYRNGGLSETITIDKSWDALQWSASHGLLFVKNVVADNGKSYDIYRNDKRGLACAIPV